MKSPALLAGVVLALAALAAPASAIPGEACIKVSVNGPTVCNCTDEPVSMTLCTSDQVQVTAGIRSNVGASFMGLSASAGINLSQMTSTGQSFCATPEVPAHTCEWWMYRFKVCVDYVLVDGFWGDSLSKETTVTFLGVSLKSAPATPDDC